MNHNYQRSVKITLGLCAAILWLGSSTDAATVRLTIDSFGGATPVTPVFAAFHDGSYNIASVGGTATAGLESLAEVGDPSTIATEFGTAGGRVSGTVGMAPIAPGGSVSHDFTVDMSGGTNSFLSLATMVLPSSDYFLGTVAPSTMGPFGVDLSGLVVGGPPITFTLSTVYDAGTELNDFATSAPPDPATMFGGPFASLPTSTPPAGAADSDSTIRAVAAPFADFASTPIGFSDPGVSTLSVTVSAVPEPTSAVFLGGLISGCLFVRRRRV